MKKLIIATLMIQSVSAFTQGKDAANSHQNGQKKHAAAPARSAFQLATSEELKKRSRGEPLDLAWATKTDSKATKTSVRVGTVETYPAVEFEDAQSRTSLIRLPSSVRTLSEAKKACEAVLPLGEWTLPTTDFMNDAGKYYTLRRDRNLLPLLHFKANSLEFFGQTVDFTNGPSAGYGGYALWTTGPGATESEASVFNSHQEGEHSPMRFFRGAITPTELVSKVSGAVRSHAVIKPENQKAFEAIEATALKGIPVICFRQTPKS